MPRQSLVELIHRLGHAFGLAIAVAVAAVPATSFASETGEAWRVTFRSGRTMEAASWQVTGAFLTLTLRGGGEVSVPMTSIRATEKIAAPARLASSDRAADSPSLDPFDLEPGSRCDPMSDARVTRWGELVARVAPRHGLEPLFVTAVIAAESCGVPDAVSHAGAVGLMQLLPTTALDYGVRDVLDPVRNVEAGCRHLARLRTKLGDDLDLVLAAYNAGEGTVAKHGGVPRYPETIDYVRRVKGWMQLAEAHVPPHAGAPGDSPVGGSRPTASTLGS